MRKILAILVLGVFFSSAWAGVTNFNETSYEKTSYIQKTFVFSPPEIKDSGEYAVIVSASTRTSMTQGYPVMPYKVEVMRFPVGTKLSLESSIGKVNEMKLNKKIMPYPHLVTLGASKNEIKEAGIYKEDTFYPDKWVEYHPTVGLYNGKRTITLSIYLHPYRYNPVKNEILYTDKIDIKINYELPEKTETTSNYDLLVIAPDEWLSYLQPLVQHKEEHGIKTKLVGLSECLKMNGRDDAEKVKYYIEQEIEQDGIKYVMLVGGRHGGILHEKWWVPVRYSHLDDNSNWEKSYLSDLYFADVYKYEDGKIVFEDWDSNGNGKYAEWSALSKDILDLNPDVYVGRLACRSVGEVKNMVNKIIEYETSNAMQQDWFKRMVVIGGDTFPDDPDDPYYEGEISTGKSLEYMAPMGIEPVKLWASDGSLLKDQAPDTAWKNVVEAISQGAGFVDFEGHGNPMSWATHPPHDENTWINGMLVSHMRLLQNKGMYPILMVGGCHNSQFNVSVLNLINLNLKKSYEAYWKSEWSPESWGWWIVKMPDKGAIASIGCTGLGYGAIYDTNKDGIPDCIQQYGGWIDIQFFKLIGNGNATYVGDAHSMAIADYVANFETMRDNIDCKTVQEWVLLGDPTLKIGGYES